MIENQNFIMSNIHKIGKELFITCDEKIKEGDWCLPFLNGIVDTVTDQQEVYKVKNGDSYYEDKKIILTTDQDLIADGVQGIDDEFLEWFVKNPSCKEVEVKYDKDVFPYGVETSNGYGWYKITIPKEEPKPHSFCETPNEKCTMNYCDENGCMNRKRELVEPKQEPHSYTEAAKKEERIFNSTMMAKQETLEEAAEKHYEEQSMEFENNTNNPIFNTSRYLVAGFIDGAKWQQAQDKNKYSDEEVLKLLINFSDDRTFLKKDVAIQWFESFKKVKQ